MPCWNHPAQATCQVRNRTNLEGASLEGDLLWKQYTHCMDCMPHLFYLCHARRHLTKNGWQMLTFLILSSQVWYKMGKCTFFACRGRLCISLLCKKLDFQSRWVRKYVTHVSLLKNINWPQVLSHSIEPQLMSKCISSPSYKDQS